MSAGINPAYLAKFPPSYQAWAKKAVGVKFIKEFVFDHGQHCFIFGTTGSGKTQKAYWLVSKLQETESIVWISSGKTNEILPLFTMGKKVRIVIPEGSEISISGPVPCEYEIVEVASPAEAWHAVKSRSWNKSRHQVFDTITVFEFRNTMSDRYGGRSKWMRELFEYLSWGSRLGDLRNLFPCAVFIDEAQWLITGRRISKDGNRLQTSVDITENVLEMRSAGCRFVLMSQGFKNIPPAARDNMLFSLLCRGAQVEESESPALAYHCRLRPGPANYQAREGKFVYPDGSTYPNRSDNNTWKFPFFPNPEGCGVSYGSCYVPKPKEPDFIDTIPQDLGLFHNRMVKPIAEPAISRWDSARLLF